nr:SMI1/KNR4 family protein [uncultured Psychroserpens sp.]
MENNFSYLEESISSEEINEFEEKYNKNLPNSYKDHIIINNGGIPDKDYLRNSEITVSCFYSIKNGKNKIEDVIKVLQELEDVLPKHLFPFAHDMGGNDFCISLAEEDYGKIYIWYHDAGGEKKLISGSFEEFMSGLAKS